MHLINIRAETELMDRLAIHKKSSRFVEDNR